MTKQCTSGQRCHDAQYAAPRLRDRVCCYSTRSACHLFTVLHSFRQPKSSCVTLRAPKVPKQRPQLNTPLCLRYRCSPTAPQVNDGSNLSGIQVVLEQGAQGFDLVDSGKIQTGAAVRATGSLVASIGAKQVRYNAYMLLMPFVIMNWQPAGPASVCVANRIRLGRRSPPPFPALQQFSCTCCHACSSL